MFTVECKSLNKKYYVVDSTVQGDTVMWGFLVCRLIIMIYSKETDFCAGLHV